MYIGWAVSALLAYPTSERTTGRERLEQRPEEDRRRMHLLVCGYGFVRSLGRRCMVSACNGLLHRGLLPDLAASSPEKAGCAAFRNGLWA